MFFILFFLGFLKRKQKFSRAGELIASNTEQWSYVHEKDQAAQKEITGELISSNTKQWSYFHEELRDAQKTQVVTTVTVV